MNIIEMQHIKPMNLAEHVYKEPVPELTVHREVLTYHPHYEGVLEQIYDQKHELQVERYTPEKVVLGAETYKQLISFLSYQNGYITQPKEIMGLEIVLKAGHGIDVICNMQEEMNRSFWKNRKG